MRLDDGEAMSDDKNDHKPQSEGDYPDNEKRREGRIRDFARRIFREESDSDDGQRPPNREILGAILETGDKAKSEIVRMIGREVRTYLEALDLHNDIHNLLTNYSLEVKASIHLKPLADAMEAADSRSEESSPIDSGKDSDPNSE